MVAKGGLHSRHVGGQKERKFVHSDIVYIKMAVNGAQRRKALLFPSANMVAMTSHANNQLEDCM